MKLKMFEEFVSELAYAPTSKQEKFAKEFIKKNFGKEWKIIKKNIDNDSGVFNVTIEDKKGNQQTTKFSIPKNIK